MTQEEMYKQETGREPYQIIDDGVYGKFLKREYSPHYITWLEKKATLAEKYRQNKEELLVSLRMVLDTVDIVEYPVMIKCVEDLITRIQEDGQ